MKDFDKMQDVAVKIASDLNAIDHDNRGDVLFLAGVLLCDVHGQIYTGTVLKQASDVYGVNAELHGSLREKRLNKKGPTQ